ncbi:unnamed protein product [Blepharisma stoltei]|uniref:Uncharacterized protein n=1 Tax=Blepharisma stoltei TaxID=1481888 RepID=A0AAU9JEJ2_9CILI|nr:unnamed protein product [Blepharisma stoltei]
MKAMIFVVLYLAAFSAGTEVLKGSFLQRDVENLSESFIQTALKSTTEENFNDMSQIQSNVFIERKATSYDPDAIKSSS